MSKNILVLAAHPDDETLGCGATIARLSSEGNTIHLLTFTDGVGSRRLGEKNRNSKLSDVSSLLGIERYICANFPDNAMDSVPLLDMCKFVENNTDIHYDMIFTHFAGDLNIDHQLVAKATLTAFRPQSFKSPTKIYSYYVPSSTDYNPISTFDGKSYFALSPEHVNSKKKALEIYGNEMRDPPHSRSHENVENLMKVWGAEAGAEYCEKFKLIREIL